MKHPTPSVTSLQNKKKNVEIVRLLECYAMAPLKKFLTMIFLELPPSIFSDDETGFCNDPDILRRPGLLHTIFNRISSRRMQKNQDGEVENLLVWRRKLSIAQYMMFHVGLGWHLIMMSDYDKKFGQTNDCCGGEIFAKIET